ncbi:right-handed parallel beta-helix repeat-containing protein [Parasaccharibacter apium]|uniref:Right handed beta helix domain-containing protein n=1 Tax=Parasaccharibacter apium TaxID=1510841 RepID=A0ABX4ZP69_9PROT|nr:right-handed parallel beta-helix repeat-containing protein [Parasaccharibacter apium]POS61409.1 hypothetical protein ASO19_08460 [Parasaccharibacter apium]POS64869.1 hypothetical protein ASQ42_01905 [Parasaccharibacter apium]POS65364.1 hypothetical protein ASQ43_03115 [Parasaccharibacter apium]
MTQPANRVPAWRSYTATGNPTDIVPSTTVAREIGGKIDAINGQAAGLTIDGDSTLAGEKVRDVLARFPEKLVTSYGVTHDPDGQHTAANSAAYQAAINDCAGTFRLVHPAGLSVMLGTLRITRPDTHLVLDGIITLAPDSNTNCLDIYAPGQSLERISITGQGIIDGNRSGQQGGQTAVSGGICANTLSHTDNTPDMPSFPTRIDNLLISGITIRNTFNWPLSLGFISNSLITNITLLDGGNSPQFIWSADNCWFTDSLSTGHTDGGFVFYMGCRRCGATGNTVSSNHDGIGVYADSSDQPANENILIANNHVHDNADGGIGITTTDQKSADGLIQRNILITGNILSNNNTHGRNGGGSIGIVAAHGVQVRNNLVSRDGSTARTGNPVYAAYVSDSCQFVEIEGNHFEDIGSTANPGTAIYLNRPTGAIIRNNIFANTAGTSGPLRTGLGGTVGAAGLISGNVAAGPMAGPLLALAWQTDTAFISQPDGMGGLLDTLPRSSNIVASGHYDYDGRTLSRQIGATTDDTGLFLQTARNQTTGAVSGDIVLNKGNIFRVFSLSLNGAITTPNGHVLLNIRSPSGAPLMMQVFTIKAAHGDRVTFPQSFTSDTVSVMVPPFHNGTNMIVGGPSTLSPPDRTGFTVGKFWVGLGGANIDPADDITVMAIGELSS